MFIQNAIAALEVVISICKYARHIGKVRNHIIPDSCQHFLDSGHKGLSGVLPWQKAQA